MFLSLYEFNQLSQKERASFACLECEFLMTRTEDERIGLLYYCKANRYREEYFIEVWYNIYNKGLDSILSFRTNRLILPYLEVIDISGLWG